MRALTAIRAAAKGVCHWQRFDLTFNTGMANNHTTAINGSGNPSLSDLKKVAERAGQHAIVPSSFLPSLLAINKGVQK